ncbi:MAG: 4-deoxy-4-formamido-L-arabinose-phosphoundecaprenol deformylase [Deltaproteobacteria bacterium]|nr:4-deoxy-4-formamido-L-arabinose-phosphoundecaprenol deformylase [Deltaproteobacteria bacterium]
MTARLALKVDVDTHAGLQRGVPALQQLFARLQLPASFFVACGPDHSGRAIRRIMRPGFLAKMRRTNAVGMYGWRTVLYGTLLPGPQIARAFPQQLRELEAAGHEVGVHGYDHVYWQDRLPRLSLAQVRAEFRRGCEVYADILGHRPRSFAAPGWQCTANSLACEDEAGLLYHSDTRGLMPYRARLGSRVFATPEIPSTWPTLDETYGEVSTEPAALIRHYRSCLRDGLNVHTIHAEVEGMAHLGLFAELLAALRAEVMFVRLDAEAARLDRAALPVHDLQPRPIAGRHGTVATQV